MTSAYHCGNCPHATRLELDSPRNPHVFACALQDGKWMPSKEDGGWTFILGCLSHPSAQAAMREEGAKQERERIVEILESWNPFQTTFGEVMESLCKQHEGAPVTPQPHCEHECHGDLCFRYRETMALGSLKDLKPCPAGTDGYIHCIHDTRTSRPATSPCEDNGCTDIENCDEICQHSRLYSPIQMESAKKQAAAQAREKVLDEIRERLWEKAFPPFGSSPEYQIIIWDTVKDVIKSLRTGGDER